ncbi:MAG: hypothetical protein MUF73_08990 [Rhodobacteraceae bacterium]|jgi:hypothetical protein|nr:hypothetical protein [Paracoccaceae bacterium]
MLFEIIATFVSGFGGAGIWLLVSKLTRGWLPRRGFPVAAGGAMIAFAIVSEYAWYPRLSTGLPPGLVVAEATENRGPLRPWTYIAPFTDRFVAVDIRGMRVNPASPDQRIADVYAFARWQPVIRQGVLFDCAAGRSADMTPDMAIAPDGQVTGAAWRDIGTADPILRAACDVPVPAG